MDAMASQITSLTIVFSTVHSDADKKTSKLRVIGICEGNSPVTGEFSAQRANNFHLMTSSCLYEIVSISIKISLKFVPRGPINNPNTDSDNGLAPTRWQAIIWTKWCIYASLGFNELGKIDHLCDFLCLENK